MYTQQIINIGGTANDGQGDPLRVAFEKINNNFSSLFSTFVNSTTSYSTGNTAGQVIFEYPANTFTQGQFYIESSDPGTPDSQTITISAQLSSDNSAVKFSGYGSTFFGNAVTSYDMDVSNGNIRLLSNPLTSDNLTHLISSQIMWIGPNVPRMQVLGNTATTMLPNTQPMQLPNSTTPVLSPTQPK
jgi:hypothetical protein